MKIVKPAIILINPQLPENIGMVARAMDNCGLEKLILVNPREEWPNDIALNSSVKSKKIIRNAKIYTNIKDAISNFHYIIATSNRKRYLEKKHVNSFDKLFETFPINKKTAFIFGPENSGLSNQDLILSDAIFNINTSKTNTSLNLSHAVLLIAYNLRINYFLKAKNDLEKININTSTKRDFIYFMDFLKNELVDVGFLKATNKSENLFNNIQNMFIRSSLKKSEIQTLWGMIKKLRK